MQRIFTKAIAIAALGVSGLLAAPAPAHAYTTYGAIAVSGNGATGQAWNYPSRASAEQAARSECGYSDCTVLVSFTRCGAVSDSPGAGMYTGGYGATRAEAEQASRRYTDSYVIASVCTS
ncbi:DUF4189 domain-containing protein [Nocardia sp. NPDC005366]|uniref:DUF4189 domain-containing protein n=1 Tax=Nocardia sp. NPDC005366 TaxID=3156878 RepID=UPI0033B9E5F1